jgi:dTDP-3-amino-3,4,6-trideoxy-alpha-D-glucose transaminase
MIPLNDFKRQWADVQDAALAAFSAVGASGWYILGDEVRLFEADLAAVWGSRHAVGVASGLDAIELSLRLLGCGPGDKVLTTPLSAFATTLAILKLGATPVFADTGAHGLLDLARCRETLGRRRDIRFLLPVHLYGHALDLRALAALREEFGCRIVEDCAQSILASFRGRLAGTVGDMAAASFYPTKNLGAMGDGGAILTGDEALARGARALRDYGQSAKYRHDSVGYNSRLDELQAALMRRVYLPKLAAWTARRRQIAQAYLAGIRNPAVRPIAAPAGSESVWHLFPVLVAEGKAGFLRHLAASGIGAGEHYPVAIPDQAALRGVAHEMADGCENARAIARAEVSLPIHPYLTDAEVQEVVAAVNRWES